MSRVICVLSESSFILRLSKCQQARRSEQGQLLNFQVTGMEPKFTAKLLVCKLPLDSLNGWVLVYELVGFCWIKVPF